MNANKNARATPYSRTLMMRRVLHEREAVKDVAAARLENFLLRQEFCVPGLE